MPFFVYLLSFLFCFHAFAGDISADDGDADRDPRGVGLFEEHRESFMRFFQQLDERFQQDLTSAFEQLEEDRRKMEEMLESPIFSQFAQHLDEMFLGLEGPGLNYRWEHSLASDKGHEKDLYILIIELAPEHIENLEFTLEFDELTLKIGPSTAGRQTLTQSIPIHPKADPLSLHFSEQAPSKQNPLLRLKFYPRD